LIEQGLPLPWPTRIVKGVSDFVLVWWWALALAAAALVTGFMLFIRSLRPIQVARVLLRTPFLGD